MDTRRIGLVLLVLMLPMPVQADRHKIGARLAVQEARRSSLWGVGYSTDFTLIGEQKDSLKDPHPGTLSAVLEGGFAHGTHNGEATSQGTILVGARYSYNRLLGPQSRLQPSMQISVGETWERQGKIGRSRSTFGLGPGLYLRLGSHHQSAAELGLSFQYDYYRLGSDWYGQPSIGVVVRFKRLEKENDGPEVPKP